MLRNLLERPKKVPGVDLLSVEAIEQSVVRRSDSEMFVHKFWQGFVRYVYGDKLIYSDH
jgi:hypothetical protein